MSAFRRSGSSQFVGLSCTLGIETVFARNGRVHTGSLGNRLLTNVGKENQKVTRNRRRAGKLAHLG